jgi:hypothetical protein
MMATSIATARNTRTVFRLLRPILTIAFFLDTAWSFI